MGRAPCCDKASVKKGPWSPEEDAKLKEYIDKYGTGGNWITLPHKAGLERCGKSCRLRWLNYLRPNIKHGEFTEVEDGIIYAMYASIGSRWSIIASQLPGRTDNDVKNYWNTKLKKRLTGSRSISRQSTSSSSPYDTFNSLIQMNSSTHYSNLDSYNYHFNPTKSAPTALNLFLPPSTAKTETNTPKSLANVGESRSPSSRWFLGFGSEVSVGPPGGDGREIKQAEEEMGCLQGGLFTGAQEANADCEWRQLWP